MIINSLLLAAKMAYRYSSAVATSEHYHVMHHNLIIYQRFKRHYVVCFTI